MKNAYKTLAITEAGGKRGGVKNASGGETRTPVNETVLGRTVERRVI